MEQANKFNDDTWASLDQEIGFNKNPSNLEDAPIDKLDQIDDLIAGREQAVDNEQRDEDTQHKENTSADNIENEQAGSDGGADQEDNEDGEIGELEHNDKPQLDYSLEIEVPMPYGMEKMTVGEMKDIVVDITRREKQIEESRNYTNDRERELIQIAEAFQGQITPELKAKLNQYDQMRLQQEGYLMMRAIPEWQDNATYLKDQAEMRKLANELGFSNTEFDGVRDHRQVMLALKAVTQQREIATLKKKLAQFAKQDNSQKAPVKKTARKAIQQNARAKIDQIVQRGRESKSSQDKQAAISELLKTL
jgi:hypothetical protein